MLKKIFREKWFRSIIHIIIIFGIFSNAFYLLENFKVNKNNQVITDQKTQLEQDKKNLTDQNSFEFLDTYKDKMIKKAGFKNTGEQVLDMNNLDNKKQNEANTQELNNYNKWYKCLFTNNYQDKLKENNELVTNNNLCK